MSWKGFKKRMCRQARGAKANKNVLNTKYEAYLNPGGWTDGRTDFALVSGPQVALCSWKEPPPGQDGRLNAHGKFVGMLKGEISDDNDTLVHWFLTFARASGKEIHILASCRAPKGTEFTDQGELIVFQPDMHMNLFRGTAPDGFFRWEKNDTDEWERRSQITEFTDLLDFCDAFKQEMPHDLKIIQLGDLVDVWHTQIICLTAHRFLVYELGYKRQAEGHAEPETRSYAIQYKVAYETDMAQIMEVGEPTNVPRQVGESSGFAYDWYQADSTDWPTEVPAFDALVFFLEELRRDTGASNQVFWPKYKIPISLLRQNVTVDYTSWEDIYDKIKLCYPEMNRYWDKFVSFPGNHDMFVDHPLLSFRYKYEWPPKRGGKAIHRQFTDEDREDAVNKMADSEIRYFAKKRKWSKKGYTRSGERPEDESHVHWIEHEDDKVDGGPKARKLLYDLTDVGRENWFKDLKERAKSSTQGFLTGTDDSIWVEHGHAFDTSNHKHVFFREDHAWKNPAEIGAGVATDLRSGFHGTYMGLIDKFKGFKADAGPSSDSTKMKIVNKKLNQFCLNRCQRIFRSATKDRKVVREGHDRNDGNRPWRLRLVVMGHTHYPWLIVAPRGYSTFLQRKRRFERKWT